MLLPSHLLLGMSVANLACGVQLLSGRYSWRWRTLTFWCCTAALAPDFDVFWSVYRSADPLIGHRGFSHSLFYIFIIGILFSAGAVLLHNRLARSVPLSERLRSFFYQYRLKKKHVAEHAAEPQPAVRNRERYGIINGGIFLIGVLILAGFTHLYADLWQPPGMWNGIPLYWPFSAVRSGGWAHMGWFDYRIVWLLLRLNLICWLLLVLRKPLARFAAAPRITALAAVITVLISWGVLHSNLQQKQFENYTQWNRLQQSSLQQLPGPVKQLFELWRRIYLSVYRSLTG